MRTASEDLTTPAKIRDAAMALFAERGYAAASIRDIASAAGVSPSLIVHHFGTKARLRGAVDSRAVAVVMDVLDQAAGAAGASSADGATAAMAGMFATALRDEGMVVSYLRRMLIEGGGPAQALFGQLLVATEAELSALVERGIVRPTSDPRWRAAFLLVNDLAALVLDDLVTVALGESPLSEEGMRRWGHVLMQTYTEGVFVVPPGDTTPAGEV
ncbi:hypothetical protein LK08_19115 [Streptomyces sp. MUSC 125]|nr:MULTISPECIES: TetR/AcrR family transcriptional regulator [Streptomyces]KIE25421.1 hypothetical protein LK08_19115 [Streptomyces sp. MUSC 125]MCH0558178.1 TetR/AcrR family transcriptional regulator [Streptomyces sp. MUM 16J]